MSPSRERLKLLLSKNKSAIGGLAGIALGLLIGLLVPIAHEIEFLLIAKLFWIADHGPWKYGIWSYEFWSTMVGLAVACLLYLKFGSEIAQAFCFAFPLTLAAALFSRSADVQTLAGLLVRPTITITASLLLLQAFISFIAYLLKKISFDGRKWGTWTGPTKLSVVFGVIGIFGLITSLAGWFGIQGYDLIPIVERPKPDVLRFPFHTHVVELHGTGGESTGNPIKIYGARSSNDGVPAEYFWLRTYYPRHHRVLQSVVPHPAKTTYSTSIHVDSETGKGEYKSNMHEYFGRCYDRLVLENWYGSRIEVVFEISLFFNCGGWNAERQRP